MRPSARAREALVPAAWFTALALAVAGPLLSFSGYLLLLDWPSGPRFPRVDFFPDPSTGAIGNTAPLDALHAGLRGVHQYLPDKVFLIAPILLGGIGVYRFVRSRLGVTAWGGILGGTLFVVNPWVIDRYLSGHLHILLAYSLLPWALIPLFDSIRQPGIRPALLAGVLLAALGVIDLHIAGMYALLAVVALLTSPTPRRVGYAAAAMGLGAFLSAWWLIPTMLSPPGIRVGAADLAVYASRPHGYGVLPALGAMYGFWRNEFVGPAGRSPALYLLLIPILGLVGLGTVRMLSANPARRFAVVLAGIALLALLLAAGTSFPPTAGAFRWLFEHIATMRIYREPQKFLALVILAYAVFAAVGLYVVVLARPGLVSVGVVGLALTAVVGYGYTQLGGLWGQVHLSRYPRDWYAAERVLGQANHRGRIVVFPWHLYAVWSFSDGRIVANPASSFFSGDVLVNPEPGFAQVPSQSTDPTVRFITHTLDKAQRNHVTPRLARVGIRYVTLLREVDHWNYRFLRRQPDLNPMYEGTRLILFENERWQPPDTRLATAGEISPRGGRAA
jgi:hypothetical protein